MPPQAVRTSFEGLRTAVSASGGKRARYAGVRIAVCNRASRSSPLGYRDVDTARRFYEALAWTGVSPDGEVVFVQAGPIVVALWDRSKAGGRQHGRRPWRMGWRHPRAQRRLT